MTSNASKHLGHGLYRRFALGLTLQPEGQNMDITCDEFRMGSVSTGPVSLWASVLIRAILDLDDSEGRVDAYLWLHGKENEIGSFVWICSVLDVDPERVRSKILKGRSEPPEIASRRAAQALENLNKAKTSARKPNKRRRLSSSELEKIFIKAKPMIEAGNKPKYIVSMLGVSESVAYRWFHIVNG